jgi:eukaryotic-like serine/threonine-protein kinase
MPHEPEGGAPSDGDDELIGTVVAGRYRLLEKLGEGGMGAVYRGVHESLRKPVAVKLLGRAARGNHELMTRFQREAVAAANLKHPNIAEATDSGQIPDGRLFMVMEYVEGRTLRNLLGQGRLAPARAIHLIRQIGAAVSFAHGREVVHRDLKPENVVVFDRGDERDLVKVIDFGIARMRSSFGGGKSGLTQEGSVVGTVEYMAPEQAMGQEVDARADQYALGVIAFELFTGQPPYVSDEVTSLIYMHVGAPIPRVTDRAPELAAQGGAALDEAVARMMGKLPDERFPSLAEAVAALASAVESPAPAGVSPPPAGIPGVTARGTIISTPGTMVMAASPPVAFAVVPPPTSPAAPPVPVPAPARAPAARPEGSGPTPSLLLIAAISGGIGLLVIVIVVIVVVTRSGAASSDVAPGPTSGALPADTRDPTPPAMIPGMPEGAGLGKGRPRGKGKGK